MRRIHKPRPIPSSHYDALPKINMQEEKDKVTHREQLEKVLKAAALNQFAVVQRTEDCMRRRRERVANAKQPPAAPAIIKAKPIPKTLFERDTAAVRLTAATILREEALIRKKQTEERLRLEQEIAVVAAGTISKRELDQKQQEIKILGRFL